jgi:hypothetical protein
VVGAIGALAAEAAEVVQTRPSGKTRIYS